MTTNPTIFEGRPGSGCDTGQLNMNSRSALGGAGVPLLGDQHVNDLPELTGRAIRIPRRPKVLA